MFNIFHPVRRRRKAADHRRTIRKESTMADRQYIMALDQGTTSSRTIIYDKEGNMISVVQREFTQIFPHEGWAQMHSWASTAL